MSALVVYESMWGNTRTVAEAVARGIGPDTQVVDVAAAPGTLADDVDLLVIGGPTHAFSLSRDSTRKDAVAKGAPPGHEAVGIRDWLVRQPPSDRVTVATFDTRVETVRHLPGSAARAAARKVTRHHLGHLLDTASFYVHDIAGPLLDGEEDRARAWGAALGRKSGTTDP